MILPDFVIIGAMKSGTSTLHRNLLHHPTIGMSKRKEPNFFNKNFNNGLDWYSSLFDDGYSCYGETSPNYAKLHQHPETPESMYNTIPEAKIVYIVRDPIDRIISHLHHDLYRDRLKLKGLQQMNFTDSEYLKTSNYFYQIDGFLNYFSKDNIRILSFEQLIKDPNGILNEVCKYLGEKKFDFDNVLKAYNTTEKKYWIYKHDLIHQSLYRKVAKLYNTFFYLYSRKIPKPILNAEQKVEIKSLLNDDLNKFKATFKLSFKEWDTYNSVIINE